MNFLPFSQNSIEEVFHYLKTNKFGLPSKEVRSRQANHGFNIFKKNITVWHQILFRQFKSSFIYLLIIAAVFLIFLHQYIDALMIILFVAINTGLGFYQEFRSEQTLKLLGKYVVAKTKVRREGQNLLIPSNELVPGDIIILETGDLIPADVRFIETKDLIVDESILTGESEPVRKIFSALKINQANIYDAKNIGFSGTTVVGGQAQGVVYATGAKSQIGEVSKLTFETVRLSSFEVNITKISKFVLSLILVTLIFVFLINIVIKGFNVNVLELLVFSIALAVSVIPEALPVVTTFSLTRGALRLAKNKVIVKRLSAIEDLGGIEVLCTDKTGTLTENQLQVAEIFATDQQNTAFLACAAFSEESQKEKRPNNSFDLALWAYCKKKKLKFETLERMAQTAFDPTRRRNSVIIKTTDGFKLIARGASEKIIELCRGVNEKKKRELEKWIADQGYRGRRVIAIASKKIITSNNLDVIKEEKDLRFEGLISFVDPIKKSTRATLSKARNLGLKIKILTGDSREVAGAVAYQVGICNSVRDVVTGDEFEKLTLKQKKDVLDKYAVFARVSPKQKFDIIKLLQEKNQVGFLGEGINDAPALKLANVALVVDGGADVAREAADIILLHRSLEVIVEGIKQGREVFANTVKYIKATLGSNFGNFYAIAVASFLIDFLPMLPLQILLLNLLSDFPMIAIATDNSDPAELKKPKAYNIRDIALSSSIFGAVSALFDFACFALFFRLGPKILQTNWFIESILTELVFLFSIRTRFAFWRGRRPSLLLLILTLAVMIITVALPFVPVMREIFKFAIPTGSDLIIIFGLVITYFIVTEIIKVFYRKFFNHETSHSH